MSGKHSKPGGGKPHAKPDQQNAAKQKCNVPDRVQVHGEIQVNLHPDIKEADAAKEAKSDSRERTKRILEVSTLFAVLVYSGLTAWQGYMTRALVKTAQDTYEAADRPYIGFGDVEVRLIYPNEKIGATEPKPIPKDAIGMAYRVQVKNFGTVPGTLTRDDIDVRINGTKIPTRGVSANPSELFPGESVSVNGTIGAKTYQDILRGDVILAAKIWISYGHANHNYGNCERIQYAPDQIAFYNLGAICDTPWTIPKK
jgi:hypothetical protein